MYCSQWSTHDWSTGIFIISDYTFYSDVFYNKGSPSSKVKPDAHHILLLRYFYQTLLQAALCLKTCHYVMILVALYDSSHIDTNLDSSLYTKWKILTERNNLFWSEVLPLSNQIMRNKWFRWAKFLHKTKKTEETRYLQPSFHRESLFQTLALKKKKKKEIIYTRLEFEILSYSESI